jgi:serine/threonine protein kinase/tetratricopeptide (TPR) repeat protein
MTPEKWQHIKELFESALERNAEDRTAFLDHACDGDESLRREVESLLASYEEGVSFMEKPAVASAAETLAGSQRESLIGQTVSHYQVIHEIGSGGMGEVYLAQDTRLGRRVALKLLPTYLSKDEDRLRRFEQEARTASALNHPNVCVIHEVGDTAEGPHYIAMEYVDGVTLRQHIAVARLKLGEVLDVAVQIASGLAAAHEVGIVHRDIKPENIMMRRDGYVKVLDFGLAKLTEQEATDVATPAGPRVKTETGMVMGTSSYMSPEQARGLSVDARTDIWSLGVVLFEMVSGKLPFPGETESDVIASILTREPPSLSDYASNVPDELEKIVRKSLRKNREKRFQSIKDLQIDLNDLRQNLQFKAKLEGSTSDQNRIQTADENRATQTLEADQPGDGTKLVSTKDVIVHRDSSADYIVRQIKQHKAIVLPTFSILLVAALGLVYWFAANRSTSINAKHISSIAVLPFENASGNSEMEYFSDGITESLINSLSQLPNTKVIARSSVFRYKGKDLDLPHIAQELSVQAILNGRVVQRGETLLVSVDLMDVQNNTHLWGQQFIRKSADILALQEEIARQVTDSLRVRLTGVQDERIRKRYTYNEEAYKLYLQGRYYWNRRTIDDFKTAIPYFQKAIEIDPTFALAYSGLSDSYGLLASYGGPADTMPLAKAAALKALALDDNLAEAHGSLGQYLIENEDDLAGAEREYRRAIELNPNYASAYQWYAELLYLSGRFEEAQKQAQRAVELDPLSRIINSVFARVFLFARRYDEAITIFRKNIELNPNWYGDYEYLFYAYAAKSMYPEAVDAYVKFMTFARIAPPSEIKATQESFDKSGWQGFLQHRVKYLEGESERKDPTHGRLAEFYAYLGEKDKAFALLERAYKMKRSSLELKHLSSFDNLRTDPRFNDLTRRLGFPQ